MLDKMDRSKIYRNAAIALSVFVVLIAVIHIHQKFFLPTELVIEVQSRTDTYERVFYDSGHGYNKRESIRLPLKGSGVFETISFRLPGIRINKIRIRPSEKPGEILIRKICIKNLIKQICRTGRDLSGDYNPLHDISGFYTANGLLSIKSTGEDPYFEFKGDFSREQTYLTPLILYSVAFLFSLALFFLIKWDYSIVCFVKATINILYNLMCRIKNILTEDSWRSILLVLAMVTIILFIRKTDSFLNPQFWAEDGFLFFKQQYESGVSAIFRTYAGYLSIVSRLVALFADSFFPYYAIPFVYNYSSLIITLFVVGSIFSPRIKINYKPLLALAIVLVPQYTNEVFMNISNIQWILCVALIIVLMKEKPNYKYGSINIQFALDVMLIIFCGLTGPFIIFLTPFFVWKWFKDKDFYNCIILFTTITIALIQLSFIIFTEPSIALQSRNFVSTLNVCSAIVGHRLFGGLFLGEIGGADNINHYFLSIMYFCLVFVILKFSSPKNNFVNICFGIQLIILMATFYKYWADPEVLISAGNSQRYFYIPHIMVVWSLIALFGKQAKWRNTLITIALLCILISSLTSGFHTKGFIDYNWKLHSQSIGRGDVVIPINPPGWKIRLQARTK